MVWQTSPAIRWVRALAIVVALLGRGQALTAQATISLANGVLCKQGSMILGANTSPDVSGSDAAAVQHGTIRRPMPSRHRHLEMRRTSAPLTSSK